VKQRQQQAQQQAQQNGAITMHMVVYMCMFCNSAVHLCALPDAAACILYACRIVDALSLFLCSHVLLCCCLVPLRAEDLVSQSLCLHLASLLRHVLLYIEHAAGFVAVAHFGCMQDMSWSFDVGHNPLPLGHASLHCHVMIPHKTWFFIAGCAPLLHLCRTCPGRLMLAPTRCHQGT
jgi:hypothetical protein